MAQWRSQKFVLGGVVGHFLPKNAINIRISYIICKNSIISSAEHFCLGGRGANAPLPTPWLRYWCGCGLKCDARATNPSLPRLSASDLIGEKLKNYISSYLHFLETCVEPYYQLGVGAGCLFKKSSEFCIMCRVTQIKWFVFQENTLMNLQFDVIVTLEVFHL